MILTQLSLIGKARFDSATAFSTRRPGPGRKCHYRRQNDVFFGGDTLSVDAFSRNEGGLCGRDLQLLNIVCKQLLSEHFFMMSGYSESELNTLHDTMLKDQPADLSSEDIRTARQVTAAAMMARYNGLLLKIAVQSEETLLLKLNCVVASELMASISLACSRWAASEPYQMLDAEISILATEDSLHVTSFAAASDANGFPVNFTDGKKSVLVMLPSPIAIRILAAINRAGEGAGWWNKAFILQPARVPEELEIQQEAVRLMSRYQEEAASESAQRAIDASQVGDIFSHELWQRVTMAVREFERTRPADGNPLTNCIVPRIGLG